MKCRSSDQKSNSSKTKKVRKTVQKKRMNRKWDDVDDKFQARACQFRPHNQPGLGSSALAAENDPLSCHYSANQSVCPSDVFFR